MRPVAPFQSLLHEKRVNVIKISVGETLYRTLQDLAARRDRSLSDYCQHRLTLDTFGELMAMQAREPADSLATTDPD
jgi:hypothetical protein